MLAPKQGANKNTRSQSILRVSLNFKVNTPIEIKGVNTKHHYKIY